MRGFMTTIPHLSESMDAMHENRINRVTGLSKRATIIGNVAAIAYIIIYLFLGAAFDLPNKIGWVNYGFILPITITFSCYFIPMLFFRTKIKKITLTGVNGIKVIK